MCFAHGGGILFYIMTSKTIKAISQNIFYDSFKRKHIQIKIKVLAFVFYFLNIEAKITLRIFLQTLKIICTNLTYIHII